MTKPRRRTPSSARSHDPATSKKLRPTSKSKAPTDCPPIDGNGEATRALAADPTTIGLVYASDTEPGITRARARADRGFRYTDPTGDLVADAETLDRIDAIVIPPAWEDVWIAPEADGHIQATGRDHKGRKQYRYHPRWRDDREEAKFGRLADFARVLPAVRARVETDLHRKGLPREKVLAAVIALLEQTKIRVGNDEYARANKSYGLTTLQDKHVKVSSTGVRFKFVGKSGKEQRITLQNKRLAGIVRRCRKLPGRRLFVYREAGGTVHKIGAGEVNTYLRELTGADYTAKDFRTWAGTTIAAGILRHLPKPETKAAAKRDILAAVDSVAERLGNTRAVARRSYIHPVIYDAYETGQLQKIDPGDVSDIEPGGLDDDERITLAVLSSRRPASKIHPNGRANVTATS